MNDLIDSFIIDCYKLLAVELGVSENCAMNIFYLRSHSRWTQEKENKLINDDQNGESILDMER